MHVICKVLCPLCWVLASVNVLHVYSLHTPRGEDGTQTAFVSASGNDTSKARFEGRAKESGEEIAREVEKEEEEVAVAKAAAEEDANEKKTVKAKAEATQRKEDEEVEGTEWRGKKREDAEEQTKQYDTERQVDADSGKSRVRAESRHAAHGSHEDTVTNMVSLLDLQTPEYALKWVDGCKRVCLARDPVDEFHTHCRARANLLMSQLTKNYAKSWGRGVRNDLVGNIQKTQQKVHDELNWLRKLRRSTDEFMWKARRLAEEMSSADVSVEPAVIAGIVQETGRSYDIRPELQRTIDRWHKERAARELQNALYNKAKINIGSLPDVYRVLEEKPLGGAMPFTSPASTSAGRRRIAPLPRSAKLGKLPMATSSSMHHVNVEAPRGRNRSRLQYTEPRKYRSPWFRIGNWRKTGEIADRSQGRSKRRVTRASQPNLSEASRSKASASAKSANLQRSLGFSKLVRPSGSSGTLGGTLVTPASLIEQSGEDVLDALVKGTEEFKRYSGPRQSIGKDIWMECCSSKCL
eukprot:TRINITY_DN63003_c0_g1_i1.p1 TRINITY_DN63003_c0_g1~~TRINITY_DN63003_c0_g1_i1.p1  ORF type:complete len:523 (+),score=83.77 TRINITY_DN63003_c0_g1_i1:124-1692(+)